ncbi:RNA-directed DNA polymerase from mobile element jockey [Fusarium oxysporum f. sp. conglutinans]|nr:RNA-directed DNA polymerase from mobile element jockey [Fusarium oxysporum f. sp. conglutinans]
MRGLQRPVRSLEQPMPYQETGESFVARITTGIRTRDRQNESNPIARTGRPTLEPGRPRDANSSRSRSPTKKQQKRANCSQITPDDPRNEIVVNIGSQRPRRTLAPSRRVLETLDANRQNTQHSQQMEVDDQELLGTEEEQQIVIHNVYNPIKTATERGSTLPLLELAIERSSHHEQIIVGDFNLHHELWGGDRVQRADPDAAELTTIVEDYCLTSNLAPGTITYEERGGRTTIDLCLTTAGLMDRLIQCEIETDMDHDSDHLPITTSLDLNTIKMIAKPRRNWKALDEKTFTRVLQRELPPQRRSRIKTALDRHVEEVMAAITAAVDEAVPKTAPSPRSKPGWNEECAAALAESKRLRRRHSLYRTEETWEAYRAARNDKGRVIKKALRQNHREKVEEAAQSPATLWRLAKWARNRHSQTPNVTPALVNPATKQQAITPSEKAELLRKTFFPVPPDTDLEDIENANYPAPTAMPPITTREIEEAIDEAAPLKAPGPDGITNKALQIASPWIKHHLTKIFNQSLTLGYYPEHFRQSTTVVLRKPGKDNYTVPKAYRPIALLNTTGKIMEAVIAKRLSYLAETHNLLPDTHMGGRKLRSTEHALHLIIDKIYAAWNTGFTTLSIDGFISEHYKLETGEPQGSNLSPILYLFYNADLIEKCGELDDTATAGFIDGVAILTWADSTKETCKKLQEALHIAEQWAATHASIFAPDKFQLTHFTRTRTRIDVEEPLQTRWGTIEPKKTCKYLGLIMDSTLTWKQHIDEIQRKVTKTVNALSSLGGSTWGVTMREMRKIYKGVAVPQMMYACSAWSNANWRTRDKPYTERTLSKLQSLQARASRAISGAYKAALIPALDVETYLLPVEQQIFKHNVDTLGRVGPAERRHTEEEARRNKKKSPRRAIEQAIRDRQGLDIRRQERIVPYIVPPWWQGPQTFIETNTEEAQIKHEQIIQDEPDAVHIYTDGSGIGGHIGAAAVCTTTQETKSAYMGDDTTSTVYAGELQGISLALQIAQEDRSRANSRSKVLIYTDNQAAIRPTAKPKGKSGAYLLRSIAKQIDELQLQGLNTEIRWVPVHIGIQGNEEADRAAKEATGWREGDLTGPKAAESQQIYPLRSTMKTWSHKETITSWERDWISETRGRASFRHTPKPSRKVLDLHDGLSKKHSALLTQLRAEKIGLKDFLYNRKVPGISSNKCPCGSDRQTVAPVLLRCRQHRQLRNQELGRLRGRNNLRNLLNERNAAAKAIKFIELTQILGQFQDRDLNRQS